MLRRRVSHPSEQRVGRLERRIEDAEDALAAALGDHRLDELASQVEHLATSVVSYDDLLEVRLEVARLAMELTRVRAELHAELDLVTAALLDAGDSPRYDRRAAG